ncbi:MAG: CIA30 family protein [Bacteroidota bacterium]
MSPNNMVLFDFSGKEDLDYWAIVDDGVMGGLSQGQMSINKAGHAVFQGDVRLENNGGFSSVRCRFRDVDAKGYEKMVIRLKGDGKRYQFRVKSDMYDYHSYITYFQTSGEWETIEVTLADMYPTFRGMNLRMPNYPGETIEEIAFLIANKKAESFRLEIDSISLK